MRTPLFRSVVSLAPLLLAHHLVPARTAEKAPFTVRDSVEMVTFGDAWFASSSDLSKQGIARFSPDHQRCIVIMSRGNIAASAVDYRLLLFTLPRAQNVTPQEPRVLASVSSRSNEPGLQRAEWLDNDRVLFVAESPAGPQQLYVVQVSDGRIRQITHHPTNITAYAWDRRGNRLLFQASPPEGADLATEHTRRYGIAPGSQYSLLDLLTLRDVEAGDANSRELFVQPFDGGLERRIPLPLELFNSSRDTLWLSPDGSKLVALTMVRDIPAAWARYPEVRENVLQHRKESRLGTFVYQLTLIDTQTWQTRPLLDAPLGYWISSLWCAWEPVGSAVIVSDTYLPGGSQGQGDSEQLAPGPYVMEVPVDGSPVQIASAPWHLWAVDPISGAVMLKRHASDESARIVQKVNGRWRQTTDVPRSPERTDVVLDENMNRRPRLYVRDESGRESLLYDPNPQLDRISLGKVENTSFQTASGHETRAGIYYPPNYHSNTKYPAVLQTHGWNPHRFWVDGPWTSAYAAQALANRGIIVVQMDDDLRFQTKPTEGPELMREYESAIDRLEARGIVDPDRLGILGFSRTGYAVAYTLEHSKERFTAATIADGWDDGYFLYMGLWNGYGAGALQSNESLNGGPPFGEGLRSWIAHAVDFNLDRMHTPLRLEAYTPHTIFFQWERFVGLSRLGRPVDLIYLPYGTHELVKPWERLTSQQGNVDWFDFWLNGREDPDLGKAEQYERWEKLCDRQHVQSRGRRSFCVPTKGQLPKSGQGLMRK